MRAAINPFLRRISYIACHEVWRLPTAGVIAELIADMSRTKGSLHEDVRTEVIAAVKRAPTLSPAEQPRIASALDTHQSRDEANLIPTWISARARKASEQARTPSSAEAV